MSWTPPKYDCRGLDVPRLIPVFQWPLDFVGRLLGFLFVYNSGMQELSAGFGASDPRAHKVKSLLVAFLVVSAIQLVPTFLFDTSYHFGTLWCFFMPVLLFVTPNTDEPNQTIAVIICDTVFSQIATVLESVTPESSQVSDVNVEPNELIQRREARPSLSP